MGFLFRREYLKHAPRVIRYAMYHRQDQYSESRNASSHYIISKEIIANPVLHIPRCQWDWHAIDYRLLDYELESVNLKIGWYPARSLYQCALKH